MTDCAKFVIEYREFAGTRWRVQRRDLTLFCPRSFFLFFFSFIDAPIQRGFSSFSLLLFFYRLDRLKLKVTCSNLTEKIFKRCIFFSFFFCDVIRKKDRIRMLDSRARALKARNWPRREENDSNSFLIVSLPTSVDLTTFLGDGFITSLFQHYFLHNLQWILSPTYFRLY